jgi:lysophospholipase L1-like esterase
MRMIEHLRGRTAFAVAATVGMGLVVTSGLTWSPEPDGASLASDAAPAQTSSTPSAAPTPADEGAAEEDSGSTRPATVRQRIEDRRTYLAVVGDAFSTGSTIGGAPTWPTLLGRRNALEVRTLANDRAGYVVGGADRLLGPADLTRLGRYPADLVVVAGGAADLAAGRTGLVDDVEQVVRTVRATLRDSDVLLLSPFAAGRPTRRTTQMTDALRRVAEREGVGFLDVSRLFARAPDQVRDGVPTAAGQRRIATAVEQRLAARAWPRYDAWLDPAG